MNDPVPIVGLIGQVDQWCRQGMTATNRDILDGRRPPGSLKIELGAVLAPLPSPEYLLPAQAQQLLVLLGLAGASVGRHFQEADPAHRETPADAFTGLLVGAIGDPFRRYFAKLADRTGTGHGARDSFASLVRWNVPAVEVEGNGQILARLESVFDDGLVRTYTGAVDELRFFGLLKASEVVEQAVNRELMPLSDGSLGLDEDEALTRIGRAVVLLEALRELNQDFAERPPAGGLGVAHFMDVFRQFAVHWQPGDIPPSGALDAEALIRDLLVGIELPGYPEHLRRVSPGLLAGERTVLAGLLERVSLTRAALRQAQVDPTGLAALSEPDRKRLVVRHPVLAALYLLLNAHARVAGVHLRLSKMFLFDPQRVRDRQGRGDPGVVSNRTGTTGMDEARLDLFTRVRREHLLAPLRVIPVRALEALARPAADVTGPGVLTRVLVRFTGSAVSPYDLGLPDRPLRHAHGRRTILDLDGPVESELV
jgi:hypothetical protein